jgi:hypothetical protein
MKKCTHCNAKKSLDSFFRNARSKDNKTTYCKDCGAKRRKKYYIKNREAIIQKQIIHNQSYIQKNNEKVKEKRKRYTKKYFAKKLKEDPLFKLRHYYRNSVNRAFRYIKINKNCSSLKFLGCNDWEIFKKHIESKFQTGMTWNNYGPKGWHIDHIIPLYEAKNEEDIKQLCHYTNLQPLWAIENFKKGKSGASGIRTQAQSIMPTTMTFATS